jgi:hypothetical protein
MMKQCDSNYFLKEIKTKIIKGDSCQYRPAGEKNILAEHSKAEQSSSLLQATSQHGHSWHRAPLKPMAIYLLNVKTFVFLFLLSLFLL